MDIHRLKLREYVRDIKAQFNVDLLLSQNQNDTSIRTYYTASRLAYLLFHNSAGYIHMGISRNGIYKRDDLLEQVKLVEQYIHSSTQTVLELGAGNGSNSAYLAKRHPSIQFLAIDLITKCFRTYKGIKNFHQEIGNYHDLSSYKDGSLDVVFAIETLCHSNKKQAVLDQVYNKLKKDGIFIIFDGYSRRSLVSLSKSEKVAKSLVEKGMAVDTFESLDEFEKIIKRSSFTLLKSEDLSRYVLPTMRRFEKLALFFYRYSFLPNILKYILPFDLLKNSFAGLLMLTCIEDKIFCYYSHVLQKS